MAERSGTAQKRHVWITGASTGIGEALARKMAREGWTVTVSARSQDKLDALAEKQPGIVPHALDVTDLEAVRAGVKAIEEKTGPIDLAVLNAGTHEKDSMETFKAEEVRRIMELNYMGVVNCVDAVLPGMLERKSGHLALVASIAGWRGLPTAAAYGASKAAVIALAESLKFDGDRLGIKVQVVNPGFVKTPLTDLNEFKMPFLMEVEDAVEAFYNGLREDAFEITFPWKFAFIMRRFQRMPYSLFFRLISKGTGK
ncbi:MAG: SDR family NAD(P)-dependent oxidoreductase [Alphaproteobacteria bacterium]|nr:SDR family NAD(P)-dependent oxidoreductase [Alphaproteobacteria bacterium]